MYKEKICSMEGCTNVFIPTGPKQKYCIFCKDKARKIKDRERYRKRNRVKNNYVKYVRKCKACGKEFVTYYKRKVYCGSDKCEKTRISIKNRRVHKYRDKEALRDKGKKYYNNNKERCHCKGYK